MDNYTTQQKTSAKSVRRVLKLVHAMATAPRTYRELGDIIDIDHDGIFRYLRLLKELGFVIRSEMSGNQESIHEIDLKESNLYEWLPLVQVLTQKSPPRPVERKIKKSDQYWELVKDDVATVSLSVLARRHGIPFAKLSWALRQKGVKGISRAEYMLNTIKQLQAEGLTMPEIAEKLDVTYELIRYYNVKFALGFSDARLGVRKTKYPRRKKNKPEPVDQVKGQPVAERITTLARLKAQGVSTKDMAEQTGLSVGTVYEYLSRAGLAGKGQRTKFGKKSKAIALTVPK